MTNDPLAQDRRSLAMHPDDPSRTTRPGEPDAAGSAPEPMSGAWLPNRPSDSTEPVDWSTAARDRLGDPNGWSWRTEPAVDRAPFHSSPAGPQAPAGTSPTGPASRPSIRSVIGTAILAAVLA